MFEGSKFRSLELELVHTHAICPSDWEGCGDKLRNQFLFCVLLSFEVVVVVGVFVGAAAIVVAVVYSAAPGAAMLAVVVGVLVDALVVVLSVLALVIVALRSFGVQNGPHLIG